VLTGLADRWQRIERPFFLLVIAGSLLLYFLLILLVGFQLGDDLIAISLAQNTSITEIFTSSVYDRGEYYRPLILFFAKLSLTPSLSAFPFRVGLVLTDMVIFALAIRSLRNLNVSLFGIALAVFFLIGSPFTYGTFTWWADMGSRHALIGFFVGAYYITAGKPFPWLVAFPVLAFSLLSQEVALAVAFLYFCTFLWWRDYKGAGGVIVMLLAYFGLRAAILGSVVSGEPFLHLPQGYFFSMIETKEEWMNMFGGQYYLLYFYNILAQFFSVFFAEPVEGHLSFVQWRHLLFFGLQTLSSIVLFIFFWKQRERKTLSVVALFLLTILANVLISYGSARYRTIVIAGTAQMLLFVWAADSIWKSLRESMSHQWRWAAPLVIMLFFGWGGRALLRMADLADEVKDQAKPYLLYEEPPDERIDSEVYRKVRSKYVD
jgi:hypothetical protein